MYFYNGLSRHCWRLLRGMLPTQVSVGKELPRHIENKRFSRNSIYVKEGLDLQSNWTAKEPMKTKQKIIHKLAQLSTFLADYLVC